ncbi:MAG TPA: GntR family transcriptional regulator [Candidatus Acidoferrales bacterium]|nr:GntR family transcriptional regulator [Candidatus Acidoferrales bacterium]
MQTEISDNRRHSRLDHLSQQAYERIRSMLARGKYPPTIVIREIDLARDFQMSRTPVREALHRLEGEGLIRRVTAGGFVADELGRKELHNIYQVREVLVGLAASLAAQGRTRVDIAHLEEALEAIDRACSCGDSDDVDNCVRSFYHALSAASGNDYLRKTLDRLTNLFRYRSLAVTHPEWRDQLAAAHRRLVDAIAEQDAARAERAGRELVSTSLQIRLLEGNLV